MDRAELRRLYNRLDPYEDLAPDDKRNVDVDSLGDRDHRARGVNWCEKLAQKITFDDKPTLTLFTGLPGTGKTTEFRRLRKKLEDPAEGNYLAVYLDATEVLDLANPIDIPEIYAALVNAAERAVLTLEGKKPDVALKDGYLTRLWNWLSTTDVSIRKMGASLDIAGVETNLVLELKTRPDFRQKVRSLVDAHLTTFIKEAQNELVLLNDRARKKGKAGLVVLFDSLERLRGTSNNWEEVIASAERLFSGGATYLKVPVHVVYTVPAALVAKNQSIEFMPLLKVQDKQGQPYAPGISVARSIICSRLDEVRLSAIFGKEWDTRVDTLVCWSGGYVREIVRMLRLALLASEDGPISEGEFLRVRNEVWDDYKLQVYAEDYDWLARVAASKSLTVNNEPYIRTAERLLLNNVVHKYLNNESWFDLHPAVAAIQGVQEALGRLGAAGQQCPT